MIGRIFGHYRVMDKLGAGGMGEVYRAHDERLDRDVALKVLPAGILGDEKARTRFRREALALSRLNHPNIELIYDFDSQHGIDFLVMEFVAGTTLEQYLLGGAMPEKEVIRLGAQVALAVEEAHERGVVHRDLKPSNIVVTAKGQAKVLDFGLAELIKPGDAAGATQTQTDTTSVSGTLRYMAPELLHGEPANARSDIWALGVLLYEMVSGSAPFQGHTVFETSTAILTEDPPPLPPQVSPGLRTIITNCLNKAPARRYQHAGQVRASLETLLSTTSLQALPYPLARRRPWTLVAGGAALLVIAVLGALLYLQRHRGNQIEAPVGGQLALLLSSEGVVESPALSADGKMVAYVAQENGQFDLFVARVAGGARIRLTNDATRKTSPAFSPDGDRVAFSRLVTIKGEETAEICVVPSLGGEVTPLLKAAADPAWSPDGTRLAYLTARRGEPISLAIANVDGSNERILLKTDGVYPFLETPAWSADGNTIAVVRGTGGVAGEIWLVPVAGGAPRKLTQDASGIFSHRPAFTPDGRGVVHSSNRAGATNLWVAPINGDPPFRLTNGPGPDEAPTMGREATVAFVNSRWRYRLLVHRLETGETKEVAKHSGYVWGPAFSPDGREIAYSRFEPEGKWHLWLVGTDGSNGRRLTSGAQGEIYPRFSPDGEWVTYSGWGGETRVWKVPRAGGQPVAVTNGKQDAYGDISPDGKWLAFARPAGDTVHIYVVAMAGGEPRMVTQSPSTLPRWSPDGKWLLFSPDRTYRGGVWVVRPDGSGERRVTQEGGWAFWWPDGQRIGYLAVAPDGNQELRVASVAGGESKRISTLHWSGTNFPADISPDGKLLTTDDSVHFSDDIWLLKSSRQ